VGRGRLAWGRGGSGGAAGAARVGLGRLGWGGGGGFIPALRAGALESRYLYLWG
jgi:hypothetical protein